MSEKVKIIVRREANREPISEGKIQNNNKINTRTVEEIVSSNRRRGIVSKNDRIDKVKRKLDSYYKLIE